MKKRIISVTIRMLWETVLYLWQLPQNLLGLMFLLALRPEMRLNDSGLAIVYRSRRMRGGISLGRYVFLSWVQAGDRSTVFHELGHCRQSRMLGPLYLIVIGLPSLLWAWLGDRIAPDKSYYWFYTEKWADRLGGVKR